MPSSFSFLFLLTNLLLSEDRFSLAAPILDLESHSLDYPFHESRIEGMIKQSESGFMNITSAATLTSDEWITRARVWISDGFRTTDELKFSDYDCWLPASCDVVGNYKNTSGVLDLTGDGTFRDYQRALRSVQFNLGQGYAVSSIMDPNDILFESLQQWRNISFEIWDSNSDSSTEIARRIHITKPTRAITDDSGGLVVSQLSVTREPRFLSYNERLESYGNLHMQSLPL